MNESKNAVQSFIADQGSALYDLLMRRQFKSSEEVEKFVYGLLHVAESIDKIYGELIPRVLSDPDAPSEVLEDRIFDLRSEFDHVDYHIRDGRLTLLPPPS